MARRSGSSPTCRALGDLAASGVAGTFADKRPHLIGGSGAAGALARVDNPAAWLYRSPRNAGIGHYRTRRSLEPVDVLEGWPDPEAIDDGRPNDATRELARCLRPLLGMSFRQQLGRR